MWNSSSYPALSQVNIFNHVQHYIRAKIQTLGLEDLQILFNKVKDINVLHLKVKQDEPSIESSLYLNMTLRYLGPLDHGTFGPLDPGTLGLLDFWTFNFLTSSFHHHLLILSHTSNFFLPPPTLSYLLVWFGLVWCQMTLSSYVEIFQCYSTQKSFLGGWVVGWVGDVTLQL